MSSDILPPNEQRKIAIPRKIGGEFDALGTIGMPQQIDLVKPSESKESIKWKEWVERIIDRRLGELTWYTQRHFAKEKVISGAQTIDIFSLLQTEERCRDDVELLWLNTPAMTNVSFSKWLASDNLDHGIPMINKKGEILVDYQDMVDSLFDTGVK